MKALVLTTLLLLTVVAGARARTSEAPPLLDTPAIHVRINTLVAERLEQMPKVAAAKWRDVKAVSDPAREEALLATLRKDSAARGLDADAVVRFFELQMRLARETQARAFAQWHTEGCATCATAPDLASLRKTLDGIGQAQLRMLYLLAARDRESVLPAIPAALSARLGELVPDAASRAQLLRAIAEVRLIAPSGLARARANGVLRFGVPGDYAPFALQRAGELHGADIALAQALAGALGLEAAFLRSSWPALSRDLDHDAFDIAIGGVSVTPERARLGRFSRVYHEGGKTLLARCTDATRFNSTNAVNRPDVRVIVNRGGTNESVARVLLPRAALIVHPDNITVFTEVAEGRADVMLTDDVEAELKSAQDPRLCRSFAGTLNRVSKALWMRPDPALADAVDGWLEAATRKGETGRWLREAMHAAADPTTH